MSNVAICILTVDGRYVGREITVNGETRCVQKYGPAKTVTLSEPLSANVRAGDPYVFAGTQPYFQVHANVCMYDIMRIWVSFRLDNFTFVFVLVLVFVYIM